ncbi:MAG TPA: response regulator [Candidatus Angelobacter sp.]
MQSVLLVEDNKLTRFATQRLLTRAGCEVLVAEDGEEALRLALAASPDVILLDMLLPKLDGLSVLARLKRNPATAHIPVIVLTGLSSKNAEKLMEAGASGFVEKSQVLDDSSILLSMLHKLLPGGEVSHLLPKNRIDVASKVN